MLNHDSRPNILLVITDQQRADAVGYDGQIVHTPYLDNLVRSGVFCTKAFTQSPQCQPSRASIFTGRYPTAHKLWWNGIPMPLTERTLGNYLQESGYRTGYFGKLHFGGDSTPSVIARHFGFQTSLLYEDWVRLPGTRGRVEDEFYGPMSTPTWTGQISDRSGHHEEIVTDAAVSFIKNSAQPFLCVVGFHGPHPPYAAPAQFSGLYDRASMVVPSSRIKNHAGHILSSDEWRELKVQYYGMVSWIDDCLGRLLSIIDDNTIVVFTSDHGDILGDHGLFSKGMYAYDGNVRVPLVFRWPGVRPLFYDKLAQSIDILPTILEACGVVIPNRVQGKSLFKAMQHNKEVNDSVLSMIGFNPRLRMVRSTRYKYWIDGDAEFLFDLSQDPLEMTNRNSDQVLVSKLRLLLLKGLIRAEDPLPQPALAR